MSSVINSNNITNFAFWCDIEDGDDMPIQCSSKKNISTITFYVTRYGEKSRTLKFKQLVSARRALTSVEKFLSQPMTQEYFDTIKKYVDEDITNYKCIGDVIGNARFFEGITVNDDGCAFIHTGS